MALSDFAVKRAKVEPKPYRLSDGDGLYVLVQPNGSKLWQLRYRHLGKENILSFGKYPLVSLYEARQQRDEAKKLLASGIDPAAVDFRREVTQAARIFPSRIDPCLNLFPRHLYGGQRSDRHGATERHPTLALPGPFLDPGDIPAYQTFQEHRSQISTG